MTVSPRRLVLAGDWSWPWYEKACATAMRTLNWDVVSCPLAPLGLTAAAGRRVKSVLCRLSPGRLESAAAEALLRAVAKYHPTVLWLYSPKHVTPDVIVQVRRESPQSIIVLYTNDDPFSPLARPGAWQSYLRLIPLVDQVFVYRERNKEDARRAGAAKIGLLRSYFIPSEHYPNQDTPVPNRYVSDVAFVGHYEDDGRAGALEQLARDGRRVVVRGAGWPAPNVTVGLGMCRRRTNNPAIGDAYRYVIWGTNIALCFFSKLNRDTYTRRNFEIPAMAQFMLSEYSDDLAEMFTEGRDAEFFRDSDELRDKVKYYCDHPSIRQRISMAGWRRVTADGHDVRSRMRQFLNDMNVPCVE